MRLVAVVMGSASTKAREDASETLLGYGFNFFETKRLYTAGQHVGVATVWKTSEPVQVALHGEVFATGQRGELANAKGKLQLNPRLIAPLAANVEIGRLHVTLGDTLLVDLPVYPATAVEAGNIFRRAIDTVRLWFN